MPGAHPPDSPGPYRLPRWLIEVRSPRCEWPGCGARTVRCDAEHDLAWPAGATCAGNLGPCCRRHHRVEQQGWTKTRGQDAAVTRTGVSGRSWLSPAQHRPPAEPVRPLPPLPGPDPFGQLSPTELEDELWSLGLLADDNWTSHRLPVESEPADTDRLGHRIVHTDTRWTLDLADPYSWVDEAPSVWPKTRSPPEKPCTPRRVGAST